MSRISLVNTFLEQQFTCDQIVSTCAGWPNGKKLASKFELDQSQHKSSQAGGHTKRKLNASPKLASTCESVSPGLKRITVSAGRQINAL